MPALLAPARRLDVWLLAVLVALVVTSALRYVTRHGLGTTGVLILLGATALLIGYALRTWLPKRREAPVVWALVMALLVAGLTVAAPSFAWCAAPVAFTVLRVVPFGWAVAGVGALMAVVSVSWWRISPQPDLTLVVGPIGIALVTVMAFRALNQQSRERAALIDRLVATQDELAAEQRRAGALRERSRLSRDIHDSIGQDLTSVHLLLQAAEREWSDHPEAARIKLSTAIDASRHGLEEIRGVIADLSTGIQRDDDVTPIEMERRLHDVIARLVITADVRLRVDGAATAVPSEVASAIVATSRGALANAAEHAHADTVVLTLTYTADEVRIDVRDDGRGFDVARLDALQSEAPQSEAPQYGAPHRGLGLAGIRTRAEELNGGSEVESEPREGTTVSAWFPVAGTAKPAADRNPA